jgi:hypothetical protein
MSDPSDKQWLYNNPELEYLADELINPDRSVVSENHAVHPSTPLPKHFY